MTTISKFTLNATEGRTEIGYSVSNSNSNRFIRVIITVIGNILITQRKKKISKVIKLFKKSNRYFMYYCIRCIKKTLI